MQAACAAAPQAVGSPAMCDTIVNPAVNDARLAAVRLQLIACFAARA
jgi:hypothetical protein